jgi:hypothetical protein
MGAVDGTDDGEVDTLTTVAVEGDSLGLTSVRQMAMTTVVEGDSRTHTQFSRWQ